MNKKIMIGLFALLCLVGITGCGNESKNSNTNNAKKGAAEDSTYGVIEAAKLFWIKNSVENTETTVEFTYDADEAKWKFGTEELLISGTKPTGDAEAYIKVVNGKVEVKDIVFGAFTCNTESDSEKVTCTDE